MAKSSVVHATFVVERTFNASPAEVFNAFADPKAKAQWFVGPEEWESGPREFDFRVGGRELKQRRTERWPDPQFRLHLSGHRAQSAHHLHL
jgi:uncharacterized protein YndB with AHSA1/START domain